MTMESRQLGSSGFKVPALRLGTFGGGNEFFEIWGPENSQARREYGGDARRADLPAEGAL
jgi:aryl-alcohol dehydrogenase-like predicted oxidoreductase